MEHHDNVSSPEIFKLWAAIGMVGAAAERRVHISLRGMRPLYPNLFFLLVAAPGIGKGILNYAGALLRTTAARAAPETLTKSGLVDAVKDSYQAFDGGPDGIIEYSSLQIVSTEFGNLVPAYDLAFMNVLNDLFDCRDSFVERTRGGGEITLVNPQISILGGTQPDYLAAMMPDAAWGMGFASRMILIYSNDETAARRSLFAFRKPDGETHKKIASDLNQISTLHGEFSWTTEAAKLVDEWHMAGGPPRPDAARLEHYITRRTIHLVKLMMISSLAKSNNLILEACDFDRALGWLLQAETAMPFIFRAMIMSGDSALLSDAASWVREQEARTKRPVAEHAIINFLRTRMKSGEVLRAFDVMKSSNLIRPIGMDLRGLPLYTAHAEPEAAPKRSATYRPADRQPTLPFAALSPPPSAQKVVPARYILRVPDPDEDDERLDTDFDTIHN